jgi:cysteine-rich repeat protein
MACRFIGAVLTALISACSSSSPNGQAPEGTCGNGMVERGEACDLGVFNDDLGACKTTCQAAACGDEFIGPGEQCDDGNVNDGDGCSAACVLPALCPNGELDKDEECDDGNAIDEDGCLSNCRVARCGDGVLRADVEEPDLEYEACDDGVRNSDFAPDACRATCHPPSCGDDVVDTNETCDDGAANSNSVPNACRADCSPPRCGDGVIDQGEGCDDGLLNSDDVAGACRTNCVPATCGDGVVDASELCDDQGDSATCNGNCSPADCGDGYTNLAAGETCDQTADGPACDADCTAVDCGDGYVNAAAAEECDSATVTNGVCTMQCKVICSGTYANCDGTPDCETNTDTSARHCGACGNDCGGGACVAGQCQPVKIAVLPDVPVLSMFSLSATGDYAYASTSGGLARVPADSRELTSPTLYPTIKPAVRAYVILGDTIYFYRVGNTAAGEPAGLYRANLAVGPASFLVSAPQTFVLASDGTYLFAASSRDTGMGTVVDVTRTSIAGLTTETLASITSGVGITSAIDMVLESNYIYVILFNGGGIWRVPRNTVNGSALFVSAVGTSSFDLDTDQAYVYWADTNGKRLRRVSKDPLACLPDPICEAEDFVVTSGEPWAVALDDSYIYWGERDTGVVLRRNLGGGASDPIAVGSNVRGTVVLGDYLFWLEAPSGAAGSIWKLRK